MVNTVLLLTLNIVQPAPIVPPLMVIWPPFMKNWPMAGAPLLTVTPPPVLAVQSRMAELPFIVSVPVSSTNTPPPSVPAAQPMMTAFPLMVKVSLTNTPPP